MLYNTVKMCKILKYCFNKFTTLKLWMHININYYNMRTLGDTRYIVLLMRFCKMSDILIFYHFYFSLTCMYSLHFWRVKNGHIPLDFWVRKITIFYTPEMPWIFFLLSCKKLILLTKQCIEYHLRLIIFLPVQIVIFLGTFG